MTVIALEFKVERDETIRMRRAADDLWQFSWQGRNADGAETGRGRSDPSDAGS